MKRLVKTAQFSIVTIGAIIRDIFVKSSHFEKRRSELITNGWDTCLPLGAKVPIDTIKFETGGGAANSASTFARWGFKTACISRIGNDIGGRELIEQLKKEKIHTDGIQIDPKNQTGYSIILLAEFRDRTILTARGSSASINPKQINWNKFASEWIYLTSVAGDISLLKSIFEHAKQTRTHVAWNPGSSEIEHGLKSLLPYLMQSDILTLNREEAAKLANVAPRRLQQIIKILGSLPRMALVITDGPNGAYATSHGVTWHVKAPTGKYMNTTGAGDAFGSGFVASLMVDNDIRRALQSATVNTKSVMMHLDSKTGIHTHLPTAKERSRVHVTEYST